MSNKLYDFLKWVALVLLPATGTLYFALSQVWGFPAGEQVVGTVVALELFLGTLLGVSNSTYKRSGAAYDGDLVMGEGESANSWMLDFTTSLDDIPEQERVVLKVRQE